MSEAMTFDPVPLTPPTPAGATPTPVPMPTTEPTAPPPPRPSRTAWVAEVLRLAATPTRRKGVAAAGVLSLFAGAGAMRLLWPIKPPPPAGSREVAGKDGLPPSPLDQYTFDGPEGFVGPPEPTGFPAVKQVELPLPMGTANQSAGLPPPVVADQSAALPPPKIAFGGPAQSEPASAYTYDGPPGFVGPPEPPRVRPTAVVARAGEEFPPRVVMAATNDPPKPTIQLAGGVEPPPNKIEMPSGIAAPPADGGLPGLVLPNLEPPKTDGSAKPPESPKVELPKPAPLPVPKPADPPKPLDPPQPAFEQTKPVEQPKVELPPAKPVELPKVEPPPAKPVDLPKVELAPPVVAAPAAPAGTSPAARPVDLPPAALPPVRPVDPAVTRTSAQTTFDVDIHDVRTGDTFATISRKHLGDDRYADAVRAFNGNRTLAEMASVEIPPIHVLRQKYSNLIGQPFASAAPAGTNPAARPAVERGGTKTYLTPPGGITMKGIARQAFGDETQWPKVWDLNPQLETKAVIPEETPVKLPAEARIGK